MASNPRVFPVTTLLAAAGERVPEPARQARQLPILRAEMASIACLRIPQTHLHSLSQTRETNRCP
jgi:hypothetical protein